MPGHRGSSSRWSLPVPPPAARSSRSPASSPAKPPPSAAELLVSPRCAHAVEKLRHAYDFVVLLGPALDREPDALRAVAGLADVAIACGVPREVPKRPPVALAGLVAVE